MVKSTLAVVVLLFCVCFSSSAVSAASPLINASAGQKKHKKISVVKSKAKRVVMARNSRPGVKAGVVYGQPVRRIVVRHGKRRVSYQHVTFVSQHALPLLPSAGDLAGLHQTRDSLALQSNVALVLDQFSSEVLFEKNSGIALPIASITKLMTGMVVVEAKQDLNELLTVSEDDVDKEKNSSSRLKVGAQLTRSNMLHIALMSSENRAASALGRNFPDGLPAFVAAMNAKAKALGMVDTHYVDSTGLSSHNVASAKDLAKLVIAAHKQPILREYSTDTAYIVDASGHSLQYKSSNRLVASPEWEIGLQKTGYIAEAGRCLVMQAKIAGRAVVMVFLDSKGKYSRLGDAGRIRKWLTTLKPHIVS